MARSVRREWRQSISRHEQKPLALGGFARLLAQRAPGATGGSIEDLSSTCAFRNVARSVAQRIKLLSLGHINMLQVLWAEAGTNQKHCVAAQLSSTLVPPAMQALRVACSVSTFLLQAAPTALVRQHMARTVLCSRLLKQQERSRPA